jgi:hypothetical protein
MGQWRKRKRLAGTGSIRKRGNGYQVRVLVDGHRTRSEFVRIAFVSPKRTLRSAAESSKPKRHGAQPDS